MQYLCPMTLKMKMKMKMEKYEVVIPIEDMSKNIVNLY